MALNERLIKKLRGPFPPSSTQRFRFGNKDVSVQTDETGTAVRMFIGKEGPDGNIRGERYAHVIVRDPSGAILRDHWDRKGIAT